MTQFCIEEACYTRLEYVEARSRNENTPSELIELGDETPVPPSLHEVHGQRHARLMEPTQ